MIAAVTERPQPAAPSAAEQIDQIAKTFGIVADPNDTHGPGLREQMLASYLEWLAMEQRCAASSLWPSLPNGEYEADPDGKPGVMYTPIPCNTRWGDWHFSRDRFPGASWTDFKYPLTRAAFVLWSVGAIEDIYDPLVDWLKRMEEVDGDAERPDAHYKMLRNLAANCPQPTTMPGAAAALRFVLRGTTDEGESIADGPILEAVIRFLEREDPRPEAVTREPIERQEPTLCAIETWREYHAKWFAYPENGPKASEVFDLEFDSWEMLLRYVPTSIEGLKAWTAVLNEDHPRQRIIENEEFTATVLQTMANAAAYLAETAR